MSGSATSEWSYLRQVVPTLDPLDLDHVFRRLPWITGESRVGWLLDVLRRVPLTAPREAEPAVLHAVLRDIGMLLATIRAHGLQPTVHVPELNHTLVEIGGKVRHVPREAIFHYAAFNPPGYRRRTFTADSQEHALIDAVTAASDSIVSAIFALAEAVSADFASAAFIDACQIAERELSRFLAAMVGVVRSVTPEFFAEKLRPHWEPICIAGVLWDGPGPVQLPIHAVDRIAWAANCEDLAYKSYAQHNMEYTLEVFRSLPNISVSLVESYARWSAENSSDAIRSTVRSALAGILDSLVKFRRVHRSFAVRAYAIRRMKEPSATGSSGHGPEILPSILQLTECALQSLLASA